MKHQGECIIPEGQFHLALTVRRKSPDSASNEIPVEMGAEPGLAPTARDSSSHPSKSGKTNKSWHGHCSAKKVQVDSLKPLPRQPVRGAAHHRFNFTSCRWIDCDNGLQSAGLQINPISPKRAFNWSNRFTRNLRRFGPG